MPATEPQASVQNRQTEFSGEQKFRFLCHEKLACFNHCCRDINIFLSPYDVLRMSRKLALVTGDFLKKYTTKLQPKDSFPLVIIKMQAGANLACPFVTPQGCSIYDERPWACRMAPLEIRGENRYGFIFDSSYCLGLLEKKEWTVAQWMANQGSEKYQKLEQGLELIPQKLKFTGFSALDQHIRDLFFMACYDLDRWRQYMFGGSFLQIFQVPEDIALAVKNDDVALLQWAIHWLTSGFDLRQSIEVRDEVFGRQ